MRECDACQIGNKREAVFTCLRYGEVMGFLCTKHATEVRVKEGVKLALLEPLVAGGELHEFPPLPPSERDTEPPAPAPARKPLNASDLDELERHAREAMAVPTVGGVCTLEADELLELVQGQRLLLELGKVMGEFKGPRP